MGAETLQCPGCGHPAGPETLRCEACRAPLKTVACPACFGLMFLGAKYCSHCGAKTVSPKPRGEAGPCPRDRKPMRTHAIGGCSLDQCGECGGVWLDPPSFREICESRERQALLVAALPGQAPAQTDPTSRPVTYLPCPRCSQLMNRMNFGGSSGVILDACRDHGIWLDAEELRAAIEFIRSGGLERSRRQELDRLRDERRRIENELAAAGAATLLRPDPDSRHQRTVAGRLLRCLLETAW